mgnify:CR=1 FL=1|jgi:hypothetical protein
MKSIIFNALVKKYEALIEESRATLEIYFNNPSGIGEHPGILEEMDKLIEQMESASGRLETLMNNFDNYRVKD